MSSPWSVQVHSGSVGVEVIVPSRGSKYCVFCFILSIGPVNHGFSARYSTLLEFHKELILVLDLQLLKFPAKSCFFIKSTSRRLREKRMRGLLVYLRRLVKVPVILQLELFHNLLNISTNLRIKMITIGKDIEARRCLVKRYMGVWNMQISKRKSCYLKKRTPSLKSNFTSRIRRLVGLQPSRQMPSAVEFELSNSGLNKEDTKELGEPDKEEITSRNRRVQTKKNKNMGFRKASQKK